MTIKLLCKLIQGTWYLLFKNVLVATGVPVATAVRKPKREFSF